MWKGRFDEEELRNKQKSFVERNLSADNEFWVGVFLTDVLEHMISGSSRALD